MWIILFFVCVSVIYPNKAQERASVDSETLTNVPYSNYAIKWDSTRSPVTLSIRDGRSDGLKKILQENSNTPLFYSNQWQPLIGFKKNNESHQTENHYSMDHQFVPTFLRRPDSEPTNNIPSELYAKPEDGDAFSPVLKSLAPTFPHPTYSEPHTNGNSQTINKEIKQNSSTLNQVASDSVNSTLEETYSETRINKDSSEITDSFKPRTIKGLLPRISPAFFPTQPNYFSYENYQRNNMVSKQSSSIPLSKPAASDSASSRAKETPPAEKVSVEPEIYQPMHFYRNAEGFIPPMAPVFFPPYPFLSLPFARGSTTQPVIPYPRYAQNFDNESTPEIVDRVQNGSKIQEVSRGGDHGFLEENIPSETFSNTIPPQKFPLSFRGFPYGESSSSIVSPFMPAPLHSLPLQQSPNAQRENTVTDIVPPSPIILRRYPVESRSNTRSDQEDLYIPELEGELLSDSPAITPEEVVIPLEKSTPVLPYEFGFDMNDGQGTDQHRKEVSDGSGVVTGSYGYKDVFGVYRLVNYIADEDGFRAFIRSNEPGVASSGSANVVVMAEHPPPQAIAEGIIASKPNSSVIVSVESIDLLPASNNTESE